MSNDFLLFPAPRSLSYLEGELTLVDRKYIVLDGPDAGALRFSGSRLQSALKESAGLSWGLAAGSAGPPSQTGATLSLVEGSTQHVQGYQLTISSRGIHAVASSPAGLFYAVMTLTQLLDQCGGTVPALRINDWPDFPNRGLMVDISRDKVPTMETLTNLIDMLASWKINQLQLYTEHTFAYRSHPAVWADASPLTGEEILALDSYCRERFIELVPNQNSFGHMRRWLTHPQYAHLAECPDGCDTVWGYFDEPFSLYPAEPGSLELVRDLFDELLPHFSSRQFNVGCDETVDLGNGRSKEAVAELGAGRVYLDFLMKIYREVKARGLTMQFWGDIIVEHPELVAKLPRDVIALEWGYEADHPFDEHGAIFAQSGIPFYVCPGTSSWNSVSGRTDNALENLRSAAKYGLKHGAIGYLNTDWGDNGHWQPLPVSYIGYGYGAALSWGYEANHGIDPAAAASRFAFRDSAGVMGEMAFHLGNAHQRMELPLHNSTLFFNLLQLPAAELGRYIGQIKEHSLDPDSFQQASVHIEKVIGMASKAQMGRPDAALVLREFQWAANMLRHACQRAIWMMAKYEGKQNEAMSSGLAAEADQLIAEHKAIWHSRNRPGGFRESAARLEEMKADYLA